MASIEFRIKNGKVDAKAVGFKGSFCESAVKKLLAGLGCTESEGKVLPDYYEEDLNNTQSVEGGGA